MSVEIATERDISTNLAPLSDIANIVGGYAFKGKDFGDCGVSIVKIANIEPPRVNVQNCDKISSDKLVGLDRFRVSKGDILMAMTGATVGKVGRVRDNQLAYLNQRVARISSKISPEHNDFIFALLSQRGFEEKILNNSSGSAQANISADGIGSVLIPQLDLNSQLQIGRFIASLDDKIDLNRQINQTLEAIAQAIFKSWFVDFDPVKAKIAAIEAGQDPLRAAMSTISGKNDAELDAMSRPQYDELALTAALFPEELVESELGDVPKGWEVKPISDVANIVMGQSPDGESYNNSGDGMALINGPVEFGSYHPKRIKWTTQITRISQVGDLIVCVRGSTTGRFVKSDGIYCLGRGVCAIRAHKSDWQPFVDQTYHFSLTALLSLATGSTFPSWNGPTLKNYRVLLPSSDLITRFSTALHPISSQISINEGASTVLSELRDTLLPKLLSGELSVADIEEAV